MSGLDFTPGRWALKAGYGKSFDAREIVSQTNALIKVKLYGLSQWRKDEVLATLPGKDEALRLLQTLDGCKGEYDRRERAAAAAWADQRRAAIAKATGA